MVIASLSSSIKKNSEKKTVYSWPTSGIATLLPQPDLKYGKIASESESYFSIDVYFASKSDFSDYVNACKNNGFIIDYHGSDTSYYADDETGNSLMLYLDEDDKEMSIRISASSDDSEATESVDTAENVDTADEETETEADEVDATETLNEKDSEISAENDTNKNSDEDADFRAWVDSYENFMNEYIDFMKEYQNSDGTDAALVASYMEYMLKYADFVSQTEELDEADISVADYAYFTAAQARVLQKMSEIE